jgi:uncharacterized membrane protein
MSKVYYIGDWAVQLGPTYAETPFNYANKGTVVINYGKWLKSAIESSGKHQVTSVPTWEFYLLGPGEWEKILKTFDIIIFSDVEAKNFQLAPQFFSRELFGNQILTFPDRVRLTANALENGTHMVFAGGWLSFNGELGKGGWGRTNLREILPVECLEVEDLVESTEGFGAAVLNPDHPILKGIDFSSLPPVLGYNKVKPRKGCEVLVNWKGSNDPLLASGQFGKGKVVAYTSDPAPHWGCNFVFWKEYNQFWLNICDWLVG